MSVLLYSIYKHEVNNMDDYSDGRRKMTLREMEEEVCFLEQQLELVWDPDGYQSLVEEIETIKADISNYWNNIDII